MRLPISLLRAFGCENRETRVTVIGVDERFRTVRFAGAIRSGEKAGLARGEVI
jgi:hypothetical protein